MKFNKGTVFHHVTQVVATALHEEILTLEDLKMLCDSLCSDCAEIAKDWDGPSLEELIPIHRIKGERQ
jgi:hypothetical protein